MSEAETRPAKRTIILLIKPGQIIDGDEQDVKSGRSFRSFGSGQRAQERQIQAEEDDETAVGCSLHGEVLCLLIESVFELRYNFCNPL